MSYIPIIARVDSLPPLPESVLELEKLFSQGDADIDKIVKIIEKDPSLMADILSKVNAPLYGFRQNIVSILQAITLLGSSQIRSIVLSSSIQRDFDIDLTPYNISTAEFSKISIIQSELMFQWYMGINIDLARIATPVAFLMETGKVLIAKDVIENGKTEEFQKDLVESEDITYTENAHTMMSTAQINALIFKHLNLNEIFWESMQYLDGEKDTPEHLQDIVLALQIVRTAINTQDILSDFSIANATTLLQQNSLSIDAFQRAVKRVKIKYLE